MQPILRNREHYCSLYSGRYLLGYSIHNKNVLVIQVMNVAIYKIRTFFFALHFLVVLTLVLTWKFGVSCFVADILGITALFILGVLYLSGLTYSYLSVVFQGTQTLFHIIGMIFQGRLLVLNIPSKRAIWLCSIFLWFGFISSFSLFDLFSL